MSQTEILAFESAGQWTHKLENEQVTLTLDDVEIISEDIPGWLVANEGMFTVALDITITEELRDEGIAREFINRIQNIRKEKGFDVTDKIHVSIKKHDYINCAVEKHKNYIGSQTLASKVELVENISLKEAKLIEIEEDVKTLVKVEKIG